MCEYFGALLTDSFGEPFAVAVLVILLLLDDWQAESCAYPISCAMVGWFGQFGFGPFSAPCSGETMLRTTKETPEVPQVLAVMLLRSTYDSVESWGIYPSMAEYQKQFAIQLRDGFEGFRGRYENYDLTELYNTSKLLQSRSGGVTNRFYFSFLNDAQWRVIGRAIRRASDREQFAQLVGSRLYQSILRGEELKSDVDGQQDESLPSIGYWPSLQVPKGSDPASLSAGCKQILKYLKDVGYCRDFQIGDFKTSEGLMEFISFVLDPVNLDATVSLMRSNNNFAPRYEQRILQAYFADSGFSSTFEDTLAENITGETTSRFVAKGIRTAWTLRPSV